MKHRLSNSQGVSTIAVVTIVVAVAIVLVVGIILAMFAYKANESSSTSNQPITDSTPESYQSNQDIDSAIEELDSTDINGHIDPELEELDESASQL